LSILEVWMLWTCKHIFELCQALSMYTLQINGKYSKNFYHNLNYYVFIVIF
jgi:hypothetical protein